MLRAPGQRSFSPFDMRRLAAVLHRDWLLRCVILELPDNDDDIETIELPPDTRRRLPAPFAVREFLVHQEPPGLSQTKEDKRLIGKLEQEDSFDEDSDESSTGDENAVMLNNESGDEDEGFDDSACSGNRVIEFGKCSWTFSLKIGVWHKF